MNETIKGNPFFPLGPQIKSKTNLVLSGEGSNMASPGTSAGDPQPPVMESTHVTQEWTSAVAADTELGMPAAEQGYEDEDYDYDYEYYDEYDDDFVPCEYQPTRGDEMRGEDDYERYMWGMIRDYGLGCDVLYDASEARYEDRD